MTKNLLPITLLSLALCSCASLEEQNKAFADYVNTVLPPLKPSPQSTQVAQASQSGQADLKEICKKGVVVGPSDVDTAYVRVMKLFRFRTDAQVRRNGVLYASDGFRHNATPGVLYDLWDEVGVDYTDGTRRGVVVGVRLGKEGAGSEVAYNYCALEREGPAFFSFMDTQFQNVAGVVSPTKSGAATKAAAKAKK